MEKGGPQEFQTKYATMLKKIGRQFPYATVIDYSPEFGTSWDTYGTRLGNFASHDIKNTLGYAQATNQGLPTEATNTYLYFDDIHNTQCGQKMTAQAMTLTLESNRKAIAAATLTNQQRGTSGPNVLLAPQQSSELIGRAGNDLLRGKMGYDALWGDQGQDRLSGAQGNDRLQGGQGSDRFSGGKGADFFSYQTKDASSRWRDTITDFHGRRGDWLGITAVLDSKDPFANPGWDYIGSRPFSDAAAELRFAHGHLQGGCGRRWQGRPAHSAAGGEQLQPRLDQLRDLNQSPSARYQAHPPWIGSDPWWCPAGWRRPVPPAGRCGRACRGWCAPGRRSR